MRDPLAHLGSIIGRAAEPVRDIADRNQHRVKKKGWIGQVAIKDRFLLVNGLDGR
jgi:hypothetical protein